MDKIIKTKKLLLTIGIVAVMLAWGNSYNALAGINSGNLIKSTYLYDNSDIEAVLKSRLDPAKSFVSTALPLGEKLPQVLINEIVSAAVNEARNVGSTVIPVNINNNHWVSVIIKRTNSDVIKVIYNDSAGTSLRDREHISASLTEALHKAAPNIRIIDLDVRQQNDSVSCGAFVVENLITVAELDINHLSDDELRNVLKRINDSSALRKAHSDLLKGNSPLRSNILCEENSSAEIKDLQFGKPADGSSCDVYTDENLNTVETIASELKLQNKQLIQNVVNIRGLVQGRLEKFSRPSNLVGVSAGENDLDQGVWIQSFMGSEKNKEAVGEGSKSKSISSKSKLYGIVLGADTKINEDTIIGIAFDHSKNTTKRKIKDVLINTDKMSSNIITLYGSYAINDNISLNGDIDFGKAVIKLNKKTSEKLSSKENANLFGSALIANYKLYANDFIEISPRLGGAYNYLSIKAHNNGLTKISKTKQQELSINTGIAANSFYNSDYFALRPEVRVDYSRVILSKGNKVKITDRVNQTIFTPKSSNKDGIKLGTSLTVLTDRIELEGGYEHSINGKSKAHLGYAKLRINF